jgi:predicted acyltransferase
MSAAHFVTDASTGSGTVAAAPRVEARSKSLDVFRGLTIIGMLLVNNPGNASASFAELRHSLWNGWTIADLIFPFFLFVVGITTHLSLRRRAARGDDDRQVIRQVVKRGVLIFAIGLLLNWFPFYQYGTIAGNARPTLLEHIGGRLLELRFLGVLQRIGIAYIAAALITWRATTTRIVLAAATLLIGYWLAMTLLPVPGEGTIGLYLLDSPGRNLSAWVDRTTLDWSRWGLGNHIWESSRVFDPEGLLSTLPAIATVLIGVLAGRSFVASKPLGKRLQGLLAGGAALMLAGLAWGLAFLINKNLWTSSYVLFTAGVACILLAAIAWTVDVRQWRGWTKPFVVFGTNPITAYVGAELTAVLFDSTIKLRAGGRLQSVHALFYDRALASWLAPGVASLAYSLVFVGLWYLVLLPMHRRGIVLKI